MTSSRIRFALHAKAAALAAGLAVALPTVAGAKDTAISAGDIEDYMVMEVCVDAADHVVPGLTPVSPSCARRRKIRPTDVVPYHLSGYDHEDKCPGHATIHDNLPVEHNGVTRIVKTVRVGYPLCGQPREPIPAYYSVRWLDSQYGFIMGAWGRGHENEGQGKVGGGLTPSCAKGPQTSARYFRNWPIASRATPAPGSVSYAVFSKSSAINGLPPLDSACPSDYNARFLSIWSRGPFAYRSGVTLDTVISHPYSQVDDSGTTPGKGRQMERTYWTREFGQVRWENWKRDDYANKKGEKAPDLARESYQKGYCSRPYELAGQLTPGMTLGPMEDNGEYSQVLTDERSGETHRWYMTGCLDLTNLIVAKSPQGDPYPSFDSLPAKFWEFWVPPPSL
ncbi:hypothetical protein [Methylocella sp.]|uniref:hypothetical protein n=1 Tax=Methylocella sp. TaxID=1978226 RepID=UPI0037838857